MAVDYEIASDVAVITESGSVSQCARIAQTYSGSITYDDEASSKFATVTIDGKSQRVMLCVKMTGTVVYDDVPSLYSTVDGHRCLNIVVPSGTETPDDVPSVYETVAVDGKNVRAVRCVLINKTPVYDGVSSVCTFVDDDGKTHTAQLVNQVVGGSVEVIISGKAPLVLPDAIAGSLAYVKAFGGTYQGNIPNTYTQVNYVTNTAQTAVDTGIMIDFAKNYEFEVECRAVSGSWYILQSRASASGNVTGIHGETSGSTIKLVVGNVTVCTSAITRTVGNKLYVKATLNNGTATLYVKDETANTEDTQTGSYGTSQPNPTAAVYLLGNAGGQYVDVNSDIYMARIKENDTVVMDYVPCRQVATAGFYDKATDKFKTAETPANLSADGNTIPTPDAPMNIVCNNGALKARRPSGLPLDYQQVEWLKSTQMIELDKPTKDTYELQSSIYREDLTTQYIYQSDTTSSGTTNTTAYLSATVGNWRFDGQTKTVYVPELEQVITKQNKNGIWLNDTQIDTYTNVNSFTSTNNLRLFGTQSTPTMRLHWFKMLENETLVYDIIPVRKISTNELGVYDKVSGQFFTNSNATLTAGNDISDPIEVYADGTVETIEDTIGNTATAEMLLSIDDYTDVQSIIDGVVTRKIGIYVITGQEDWTQLNSTTFRDVFYYRTGFNSVQPNNVLCTHYLGFQSDGSVSDMSDNQIKYGLSTQPDRIYIKQTRFIGDVASFKAYLSAQFAAGTPVIVIYPLETPTTESVAGQTLQVTDGDNTLEITQASMYGLELEAKYSAAVALTIQEVQDANLDPNVEVTII